MANTERLATYPDVPTFQESGGGAGHSVHMTAQNGGDGGSGTVKGNVVEACTGLQLDADGSQMPDVAHAGVGQLHGTGLLLGLGDVKKALCDGFEKVINSDACREKIEAANMTYMPLNAQETNDILDSMSGNFEKIIAAYLNSAN